jgi:hypothetical protein
VPLLHELSKTNASVRTFHLNGIWILQCTSVEYRS